MSHARHPEVVFFLFLGGGFAQIFRQIVYIIVKTLRNTNFVASRCFKMKKTSLLVNVHSSKTPCSGGTLYLLLLWRGGGGRALFLSFVSELTQQEGRGKKTAKLV